MSVQAGIWNLNGTRIDREQLSCFGRLVSDYSPDGEQMYIADSIGMLYGAFHTTPQSHLEKQPHTSAMCKVIMWDGRLDNRDDLIGCLPGVLTTRDTDLAIVAAMIDRWGTDCFSKLMGDWAVTIWDAGRREVIFARDYLGVRHLFYHATPTALRWCTHLEPLVQCGETLHLCEEYIAGYLVFYPDAHLTPYKEIRSVPPASYVTVRCSTIRVHPYWTFKSTFRTRYKTDAEYEEQFRYLFRQSVRRRLRADSPVLAELSGGLDSSSIVCMADDIVGKEGGPKIDTFSYWDPDEPDEEDQSYFVAVEQKRGTVGHRAMLRSSGDTFSFQQSGFVAAPGMDGRLEIKSAIEELRQRGKYRVLLSGRGGDEATGQALDFRVQLADLLMQMRFAELGRQLVVWSLRTRVPLAQLLAYSLSLLLPWPMRVGKKHQLLEVAPWICSDFVARHPAYRRLLTAAEGRWHWLPSIKDGFQTISSFARELSYFPPSRMEKRYPFFDQTLLEFLISIPTDQLVRPGHRRSLMRRALAGLLPAEIESRRTKASTGRCVAITCEKHCHTVENLLIAPLCSELGFVDARRVREAFLAAKNGRLPDYFRLMRALSLEIWLRDTVASGVVSVGTAR